MPLDPAHYPATPVAALLEAASVGRIGVDQRLLRALMERRDETVQELVRFTAEAHGEDPVPLENDAIDWFRALRAPEGLPFLLDVLREDPEDTPEGLTEAIHDMGAAAVEPLLALIGEGDDVEQSEAAFLLASLNVRDDRILNALQERFAADPEDGAFLLGVYGDPATRPLLERYQAELEERPEVPSYLRQQVAHSLDRMDAPAPTEDEAFDLLALYPETEVPAFDVLTQADRIDLLDSGEPEHRKLAAASLSGQELTKPTVKRLLRAAREDEDENVRAAAWEALGTALDEPGIREALLQRLREEGAPRVERLAALVALASDGAEPVREDIERAYQDPESREKALQAMWRSRDRTFADYFPRHLEDDNPEVRRQAIWGVGALGLGAQAGRLEIFFDEEGYRPDALFSYALAMPAEITRGRVRGVLRRISDLAGGLNDEEELLVQTALDERLVTLGLEPVFLPDLGPEDEEPAPAPVPVARPGKVGRNDPCHCGSGKKYKKCCGG